MSPSRRSDGSEPEVSASDLLSQHLPSLLRHVGAEEIPGSEDLMSSEELERGLAARGEGPFSLVAVGDIMLGGRLRGVFAEHGEDYPFAGVRPHSVPTYRIERSSLAANVITIAGIRSTGVSGSPGIADYVAGLLADAGLTAKDKDQVADRLDQPMPLRRSGDCAASASEPLGRTVVCACEKVTAAEIHQALQGPVGARSISGIGRRTHAMWGRCQ